MTTTRQLKFHSIEDYGGADSSTSLFTGWGWKPTDNLDGADVIIFNGGTDIATEIYDEKPIMRGIPALMSVRDRDECEIFEKYRGKRKLLLGICRGAQLLNCLNGGSLWQDVNNHGGSHDMLDILTGEVLRVTSTHHQQMRPNLSDGVLIGISSESSRKFAWNSTGQFHPYDISKGTIPQPLEEHEYDTEIMWYPKSNSLCIQGHPEYVPGSRFAEYAKGLIELYLPQGIQ